MTFPSHFPWFPAPCPYLPVTAGLWVSVQRALIGTNCPGTGITQCVAQFFSLFPMRANWPSNSLLPGHLCALCFGIGISPACGLIYHQLQCTPQFLPEHCLCSKSDSELCANTDTVISAATSPGISRIQSSDTTRKLMLFQTMPESFRGHWSQAHVALSSSSGDGWGKNNLPFQRGRGVTAVSQHQGWVSADSWGLLQFPLLSL